jgi:hypothetical protein
MLYLSLLQSVELLIVYYVCKLVEVFNYRDILTDESYVFYHNIGQSNHAHRVRRNVSEPAMTDLAVSESWNISAVSTVPPWPISKIPTASDGELEVNTDLPLLESTSLLPDNSTSANFSVLEVRLSHLL